MNDRILKEDLDKINSFLQSVMSSYGQDGYNAGLALNRISSYIERCSYDPSPDAPIHHCKTCNYEYIVNRLSRHTETIGTKVFYCCPVCGHQTIPKRKAK